MRQVGTTSLGTVDARAWPSIVAGIVGPRVVVARLSGGAAALGRWQDAGLTLKTLQNERIRRIGGGRTVALGEGLLAVACVLPHRGFLESDHAEALPAQRFLNRAVRPLLTALAKCGVAASYGGRDFVTVDGGQGALVSFDVDARGRATFEAYVPAGAHWWLPGGISALPERTLERGFPGPAMVPALERVTAEKFLDAFAAGLSERFGLVAAPDDRPIVPAAIPDPPLFPRISPRFDIPVGTFHATVDVADGRLAGGGLVGEFLSDSAGMGLLAERLRGCPATFDAIAAVVDATFGDPAHALVGVDDLATVARAVVLAAEAP